MSKRSPSRTDLLARLLGRLYGDSAAREILREIGYGVSEIEMLRQENVIS